MTDLLTHRHAATASPGIHRLGGLFIRRFFPAEMSLQISFFWLFQEEVVAITGVSTFLWSNVCQLFAGAQKPGVPCSFLLFLYDLSGS